MADDETEYISVAQAVKLISKNFDGNPKDLREFCEGVESAREVVHPTKQGLLLKFVESKITGEAKARLLARNERNTWDQIKAILEENYAVKRTLEYYASMLFTAKQGTGESVAQWGSKIDSMGIDLMREARLRIEKVSPHAVEGGTILISEFMKGSFIAGLKDERIKYIVKARGEEDSLAQLVETALQEESEIQSMRFKGNQGNSTWTGAGYSGRRDHRPQIKREVNMTSTKCFVCQRTGHIARFCSERKQEGPMGRSPRETTFKRNVCEKCHKVGHEARYCRVRNPQGN
jgi:hypothetical protein